MKVNVDISSEYNETHAVIYADKMTEEVTRAVDLLSGDSLTPLPITVQAEIVKLKNGASDFVSRKYLPAFKKYLGR